MPCCGNQISILRRQAMLIGCASLPTLSAKRAKTNAMPTKIQKMVKVFVAVVVGEKSP